jgi:hypothetical protein
MLVAIREVFGLLYVFVFEVTFIFFWEPIGLEGRLRETTGEFLLVFTDRLELALGGFLVVTAGALLELVFVELLDLETLGVLLRLTEVGRLDLTVLLWGVEGLTAADGLLRRVCLAALDDDLELLLFGAETDLRGVLLAFTDCCLLPVDLGL